MTVRELMESLKDYPGDMQIIVQGYEDGYETISDVLPRYIVKTEEDTPWYNGEYDDGDGGIPALLIYSRRRNRLGDE